MESLLEREDRQVAEALRVWLAAQRLGTIDPVSVGLRREEDASGTPAWFFDVVLPDPDPAAGTWPVDDLVSFDRQMRDEAIMRGLSWPWYVLFRPETDEPQADEDNLDPDTD